MRIAVNTRFLLADSLEGIGYFISEIFQRITRDHPEHEFIFIFDRPYDKRFVFENNVTPVVAGPAARHPILWKFWYDVKLPSVLKRVKADVFVSCDGFCSLNTSIPQCLLVHDLSFLHFPRFILRSHLLYYKYYTPLFMKKANSLATVSEFSRNDIIAHYENVKEISIVPNAAREGFRQVDLQTAEEVKEKYTEGKEYFIYSGSIHPRKNLRTLLRAFSIFKKRQKSNWKLVFAGRLAWKYKDFVDSLKTYKYRSDVVLTGYVEEEELARLVGAAYALVYPSLWEGFGVPVVEAMRAGVPVITSGASAMQEVAGDAALYADPADHQQLAERMMTLYKDELLRASLISKGTVRAGQFDWNDSAARMWECIRRANPAIH